MAINAMEFAGLEFYRLQNQSRLLYQLLYAQASRSRNGATLLMKLLRQLISSILIATVMTMSVSAKEDQSAAPQAQESSAIINGTAGSTATYPWIAFLTYADGQQYCGASLISSTWILTAAHCFLNEANTAVDLVEAVKSNIILNSNTVSPLGPNAIRGAIGRIIIHPNYAPNEATSANSHDFDIALVQLTAAVSLQPIPLLAAGAPTLAAGTEALILGWGNTAVDSENKSKDPSNILLKASQKIVGAAACGVVYGASLTANMLCAGGLTTTDTTDTCQGDSGGPLSIANGNGFIQVGIVSFGGNEGPACGDPASPGVYANVSVLAGFIRQHATDATFTTFGSQSSTPVLSTTVNGSNVTISWTAVPDATGYTLYYAPFPAQSPIGSLNVGSLTTLTGALPSGSAFYVAVQPYRASGPINVFSNVGLFTIP